MKNRLQSILPRTVPSPLFVLTCALLLVLGGICWAATDKIARDADEGMRVITQPTSTPAKMVQSTR